MSCKEESRGLVIAPCKRCGSCAETTIVDSGMLGFEDEQEIIVCADCHLTKHSKNKQNK